MNPEKSVRRATKNLLNALQRLEREKGLAITDLEIHRHEIISDNEFGTETRLDSIEVKTKLLDHYLREKKEKYWEEVEFYMNRRYEQ